MFIFNFMDYSSIRICRYLKLVENAKSAILIYLQLEILKKEISLTNYKNIKFCVFN